MIRIVIADDEELIRTGLRTILTATGEIEVIGEAGSGGDVVEAVARQEPDVAVLDLVMPGELDGAEAARQLRARHPDLGILILTTRTDEDSVARVWRAGADGYLLKTASGAEMIAAVRQAAEHRAVLSPDVISSVMDRFASHRHAGETTELELQLRQLSAQELRTVLAVADGLGNRDIAGLLGMAEGTVKTYVSRALHKLALDNRTQLALLANDHRGLLARVLERAST
ncbi:response regulator [Streptomyces sp. NPDC059009]|uniref:response regulator n=1 Tax=Streptomyces sp. NPDC059009 TaxID=3346694 RepID=UPI0036882261